MNSGCRSAVFALLIFLSSGWLGVAQSRGNPLNSGSDAQDVSNGLPPEFYPANSAQSAGKEMHINVDGFPEPGMEGGVVLPTSAGLVRIDVHPAIPPSGRPIGKKIPDASGGMPLGETLALVSIILAAVYLISSLFFKGKTTMTSRGKTSRTTEKSGLSEANYPIVRIIGRGGMGVVYEAVDRALDRKVAIKKMREEIRENAREFEQFLKEAKTVASLHHPAIVDIHSIVEQGGEVYLVFEFVEGKTVEAMLKERGRLSLGETRRILEPVCQALEFAHERKVIHRDLKPSNVMVTHQGFVKVMDFGIARRAKDSIVKSGPAGTQYDMTNSIAGTPLYMAPEAEMGIVCPQSDIYSLGIMTYEMLAGKPPFIPPVAVDQKLDKNYLKLSQRYPGFPASVDDFIDATLEPQPEKRIRSARAFWCGLASLA